MELSLIVVKQILVMFLLSSVGYLLFKSKRLTMEGSRCLGQIMIYGSLPCVIINGFLVDRTPEHLSGLLWSAIAAAVSLLIAIVISHFLFPKNGMDNFASCFSNAGFFGIPLISATLGSEYVFYLAAYIAFLNLLQWTYGMALLKGENGKITLKQVLTAPFMIAIIIGLFLFLTQIPVHSVIKSCLTNIANLNTPLAMFVTGVYLAGTDFRKMMQKQPLYTVSAVRLLLIPAVTMVILAFFPEEVRTCVLIAAACPVGTNIAIYAQLLNKDYTYASETVVLSTLLCVISIPVIVLLANFLWNIL